MYLFPTYFAKRNLRSPFSIKSFAKKIWDVMWGWKILYWKMKHSNYHLRAIILAVRSLAKISQGYVFHRIPDAIAQSKWFQQRWMQNIHYEVLLPKDKNFLFARVIAENVASRETFSWRILYLFPYSSNP